MRTKKLLLLVILLLFNFASTETAFAITRDEIMSIAEAYKNHQWMPTEDNICHKITKAKGCCVKWNKEGKCIEWVDCRIDTPDIDCKTFITRDGIRVCNPPGWWQFNQTNIGLPYQWGGCSSVNEVSLKTIKGFGDFDEGIKNKDCSGDVYCYGGRESGAAGVDCSGFVSRSWNLNTKYSTSSLPKISKELDKYEDLKRGDIVNKYANHVMLFKEFDQKDSDKLWVYESSANDWKVDNRNYKIKGDLQDKKCLPYTYLNLEDSPGIDVELIIDRSGSMGAENKLENAKSASKYLVDLMKTNDKIGVVSFSTSLTSVNYQLTEIDASSSVKTAAKNAIDKIFASGKTPIGAGLWLAREELNTYGKDDPVRVMILLSDGQQNAPPHPDLILPGIIEDKIKVCTIGLGKDVDENLLRDIASQTGCVYRFAPDSKKLQEIYRAIQAEIAGEDIIKIEKGKIKLEKKIIKKAFVDASVSGVTFSISWVGSDLDLTLIQPNGEVIDRATTNPDIEFVEGTTYEFYRIDGPMQGEWTMEIFGKEGISPEGEDFTLTISGQNAMLFNAQLNKPEYSQGDKMVITASIEDQVVDSSDPQLILGADVEVEVTNPNQQVFTFKLYDNGIGEDEEAGDGIYTNFFSETFIEGSYTFKLRFSGLTNRIGDTFTREKVFSTAVVAVSNQPPVADAEIKAEIQPKPLIENPDDNYIVEANTSQGVEITLDGAASYDPEGSPLTYKWSDKDGNILGTDEVLDIFLSLGKHQITLTASDEKSSSNDILDVTVQDTIPPEVEITSPEEITYFNTQGLLPIKYSVKDICDTNPEIAVYLDGEVYTKDSIDLGIYLGETEHSLKIEATDKNGNIRENSVSFEIAPEPMKSFLIKEMKIRWAFDHPGKHLGDKTRFTVFGSFDLPEEYQKEALEKSALFYIKIKDKEGKDKTVFKTNKNLWLCQDDSNSDEGIDIKTMVIHWLSKKEHKKNWFFIKGELSLEGIDIDTLPQEAVVTLEMPVAPDGEAGSLAGRETIEFEKFKHIWFYHFLAKWKDWQDGWWKR